MVVPCFNEGNNIDNTVHDILAEAGALDMDLGVLLIDDGSTDNTRDRIEALKSTDDRVHVLVHERNRGVGTTVLDGVAWARPDDWVTIVPGDNEFVFKSIHNFLRVREQYDLILGFFQNPIVRTLPRRVASEMFVKATNFFYGWRFRYLNGMYLFRARVFKNLHIISGGHAFTPELVGKALLREPLLRIGEVPFASRGRAVGDSKAFQPRSIARALKEFYQGHRAVSSYRDQVVSGDPDRTQG